MTVTRVEGVCNGATIIFTRSGDGSWDVNVPTIPSGTYVVSVTAYDEAGNSTYLAMMLFSVDVTKLEVKVMPLHFSSNEVYGQFETVHKLPQFGFAVIDRSFVYRVQPWHFKAVLEDVST